MKKIHTIAILATMAASLFTTVEGCSKGENTAHCQCVCSQENQVPERVNYRYKYRYFYPNHCFPRERYYHKEYGVQRRSNWPGRIYEPFHQSLQQ